MVATGFRNKFDVVPGLGPGGYAQTITTLGDAERAGRAWREFLGDPGPVVIGATQGASCFGAAYEFLFNTAHQLRRAGLQHKVPLTFVTAEPFVGVTGHKSQESGLDGGGVAAPGTPSHDRRRERQRSGDLIDQPAVESRVASGQQTSDQLAGQPRWATELAGRIGRGGACWG